MRNNTIVLAGVGLLLTGSPAFCAGDEIRVTVRALPSSAASACEACGSAARSAAGIAAPSLNAETKGKYRLLLGILPSAVDPALQAQLGLNDHSGVVVQDIVANGPADKAGIRKYDIITKVAGKPISAPKDLHDAIGSATPGDTVQVELLRSCVRETVDLVLDQTLSKPLTGKKIHQLPPLSRGHIDRAIGAGSIPMPLDMYSEQEVHEMIDMMSRMMERDNGLRDPAQASERIRKMRELAQRMDKDFDAGKNPGGRFQGKVLSFGASSYRVADEQGSIEMTSESGKGSRLVVRDPQGNTIFDGPFSTDEDKAKVPAPIMERLKKVCIRMKGE